jgi:putative SOS response-associated peptidase YedK
MGDPHRPEWADMCGRFVQTESARHYADYFEVDVVKVEDLAPAYNVAPTDTVYAVAKHDDQRQLGAFRWGLIPWWAKDRKIAARNINARIETVATKPTFRDAFERKRCLIPADGFYEWQRRPDGKLPHFIYSADRRPLAFAGLWASWKDPETQERVQTCTILTGEPNELVEPIHNRMPVALTQNVWDRWLDPANRDADELFGILNAAARPRLAEHPVSTLVNKVANNIPELIVPLETGAVR